MIELLIGLGILGLMVGVLGASLVLGFRTTAESGNQVNEAAWGRIITNWFTTDVKAAAAVPARVQGQGNGVRPDQVCGEIEDADFILGFSWPADPNLIPPTTTSTLPEPSTTTTLPTVEVDAHHADWWFANSRIYRVGCDTTDVFWPATEPDPDPGNPIVTPNPIARGLIDFDITCTATACTAEWVAPAAGDAPDRPYSVRVGRRAG